VCRVLGIDKAVARQHHIAVCAVPGGSPCGGDTGVAGCAVGAKSVVKVDVVLTEEALGAGPDQTLAHEATGGQLCRTGGGWVKEGGGGRGGRQQGGQLSVGCKKAGCVAVLAVCCLMDDAW
jgi:hypothetical protein